MIVEITLSDSVLAGILAPAELQKLLDATAAAVPAGGTEGVILSGRLPVWAYGALVHFFHPRPWVATYDPRLDGGVVVATHTPDVSVGDVVPVDGHETVRVEV